MNALIIIGAYLIIEVTAQYIDPFVDPNCPFKNGQLLHDPINHLGPGPIIDPRLPGVNFDTPAIGHRVDISVSGGRRFNPISRRWKRSTYRAPGYLRNRNFPRFNRFDRFDRSDRFDNRGGRGYDRDDFRGVGRDWRGRGRGHGRRGY